MAWSNVLNVPLLRDRWSESRRSTEMIVDSTYGFQWSTSCSELWQTLVALVQGKSDHQHLPSGTCCVYTVGKVFSIDYK